MASYIVIIINTDLVPGRIVPGMIADKSVLVLLSGILTKQRLSWCGTSGGIDAHLLVLLIYKGEKERVATYNVEDRH